MSNYAVILAAGPSRRMGQPKALLELGGSSLLQRTIGVARGADFQPLVVLGADAESVAKETGDAQTISNPNWKDGMGTSIARGISALPDQAEHAVIMAVDQPEVDAGLLRDLLDGCTGGADACATRYPDGNLGVPTCFSSALFDELSRLDGDRGAKKLLHADRWRVDSVDGDGKTIDVDTPEQWSAYLGERRSG